MTRKDYKEFISFCKMLVDRKLVEGSGGNVSIKKNKSFFITSSGARLNCLRKKDIVKISLLPERKIPGNVSCEWKMHDKCYKNRNDINCIIHTHPVYVNIFALTKKTDVPVSCEFFNDAGKKFCFAENFPAGSEELALSVSKAAKTSDCIILPGHGLVVLGNNLQQVFDRTVVSEREAKKNVFYKIMEKLELI